MFKRTRIVTYFFSAVLIGIASFLVGSTIREIFRANLYAIREIRFLAYLSDETINEMYWAPLFDWQKNNEVNANLKSPVTDVEVMIKIFEATLKGNGDQVILIGQEHTDTCLKRPSCQILYARAAIALDREDIIQNLTINDITWQALSGKGTPQVWNEVELANYQMYYEKLLTIFPQKPDIYQKLGSINRAMGHWDKALPYFEQALALVPDDARYRCNVGEALVYTNRDPDLGIIFCLEAMQLSPEDLWLYEKVGRLNAINGACKDALSNYEEAVIRFPERSEPQQWVNYLQSGNYEQCNYDH